MLSWNWHLDLICEYLELVASGDCRRLIINVPPRTMKSLLITVMMPCWQWCTRPEKRFLFASYSSDLSTDHSVFRRNVMRSEWYQDFWKDRVQFATDQNLKTQYENTKQGRMVSTSLDGTATGKGGDGVVTDDPLNPKMARSDTERESANRFFDHTLRSRLNDLARGFHIIVMQRLHELDLSGHLITKEPGVWTHISLPMTAERDERWVFPRSGRVVIRKKGELLWPDRFPKVELISMQIGMGSWAYAGQYQQRPAPEEGGIIKREWIKYYRELPAEKANFTVQSWDCTFKDRSKSANKDVDFVCGGVWARWEAKFRLLPWLFYERAGFTVTQREIKQTYAKFPEANVCLIEDKANGSGIIETLQGSFPGIVAVEPEGGKEARLEAVSPLFEAGNVELPDPTYWNGENGRPDVRQWVGSLVEHLCGFPNIAHDDDVDMTSQALIYMKNQGGGGLMEFYRREAERIRKEQEAAAKKKPAGGEVW